MEPEAKFFNDFSRARTRAYARLDEHSTGRANQAVIELKSQIQLHHMIRSTFGRAVKKMEELLSATGADLVHAPGIWIRRLGMASGLA